MMLCLNLSIEWRKWENEELDRNCVYSNKFIENAIKLEPKWNSIWCERWRYGN